VDCFLQVPHLIAQNPSAYSSVDSVSTTVSLLGIGSSRACGFGAESADVGSLGAAGLVRGVVAVLACAVPARRTAGVGAPCQRGAF
jgi:hypothetical protein